MIFITFKTPDKTCSKIEKAWFLLLQWVARSSKMNEKMFILIYLSNNLPSVAAISSHTARSMPSFNILSSSKKNTKEIGNF